MTGETGRQPIQLQPDVKREFDTVHRELRESLHDNELTQSAAIKYLIVSYREHAQPQRV